VALDMTDAMYHPSSTMIRPPLWSWWLFKPWWQGAPGTRGSTVKPDGLRQVKGRPFLEANRTTEQNVDPTARGEI